MLFAYGDATGPLGYYATSRNAGPRSPCTACRAWCSTTACSSPWRRRKRGRARWDRFVGSIEKAVFLLPRRRPPFVGPWARAHGFLLEALGEGTGSTVDLTRDERGERYFPELLDRRPVDRWERSRRNGLLSHYGKLPGAGRPVGLVDPSRADGRSVRARGRLVALPARPWRTRCWTTTPADDAGRIAAWLARGRGAARPSAGQAGVGQAAFRAGPPRRVDRRRRHRRRPPTGRPTPATRTPRSTPVPPSAASGSPLTTESCIVASCGADDGDPGSAGSYGDGSPHDMLFDLPGEIMPSYPAESGDLMMPVPTEITVTVLDTAAGMAATVMFMATAWRSTLHAVRVRGHEPPRGYVGQVGGDGQRPDPHGNRRDDHARQGRKQRRRHGL